MRESTSGESRTSIAEALASSYPQRIPDSECDIRAAVALVLSTAVAGAAGEPAALFVRRARSMADPWSGHMALPGGRVASGDVDLLDTARRETLEETGLELARQDFLGRLDDIHPRSRRLPSIAVTPFVAWQPTEPRVRINRELSGFSWITISVLAAPEHRVTYRPDTAGGRVFPAIRHEASLIWGLTLAIVENFLSVASGSRA